MSYPRRQHDAIRGRAHDGLPTFEGAARAAAVVDAVVASARSRSRIDVTSAVSS
jgi:hypothetical protein